jgi:PTS system cellobiose-specific IIC component
MTPAASRLARAAKALADQPHLCAIRDGVVAALPLVLFASVILLVAAPPVPALAAAMKPHAAPLIDAARAISGGLALYVTFACAQSLARRRDIEPLGPALAAVAALMLLAVPLAAPGLSGSAGSDVAAARPLLERLNQTGLFAGLMLGLASAEIFAVTMKRGYTVALPAGAPPAVARSFAALVPAFAVLLLALATRLSGVDVIGASSALAAPLAGMAETYGGVLVICLADAGLYYLGIHPGGVLAGLSPLWLSMLMENQSARVAGAAVLPHIATREFFLWFVWQGGSGGTLAMSLLLLGAAKPSLRAVARLALVPSLFNVNEPLLFGVPIVLNPKLLIPFVLGPLVTATVAYGAFAERLVSRPSYEVLWTLPAPLGAFLACGDWRALALALLNLTLSALIWWPFVRRLARD